MFQDDYEQEVLLVISAGIPCPGYRQDVWEYLPMVQLPAILESAMIGEMRRIDHLFSQIANSPPREAAESIWNLAYGNQLIYYSRATTPRSMDDRTSLDPYLLINTLSRN